MSNQDDYNQKLKQAQALTPEQIKTAYMPIGIVVQEAEDLYQWAKPDIAKLKSAGLAEEVLEDLPALAGALREAQSLWMRDVQLRKAAEEEWAERAPAAFDTRDRMLHAFRYAFRKDAALQVSIDTISEGGDNADMVQDLNDLAVLGKQHTEALTKIGIETADLEALATLSDEMAVLLARANGEREGVNESRELRDRFYTLLKDAVDEVRDCGKYVFWRDKNRVRGYSSKYIRTHRFKNKGESPKQTPDTEKEAPETPPKKNETNENKG